MARGGGSKWRGLYHSMMITACVAFTKSVYIMGLYLWLFGSLDFAFLERCMNSSGVSFGASLNRC